jgi:hypothetical protein
MLQICDVSFYFSITAASVVVVVVVTALLYTSDSIY